MNEYVNILSDDIIDGVIYFAKRLFASMPKKESTSDNDIDSDDSMKWKKWMKHNNKNRKDSTQYMNDDSDSDDTHINDNLNTKPSAVDTKKLTDDKVKEDKNTYSKNYAKTSQKKISLPKL